VLEQDVNVVDVGHYSPTTKEGIAAERAYMVDLHQQVLGSPGTNSIATFISATR